MRISSSAVGDNRPMNHIEFLTFRQVVPGQRSGTHGEGMTITAAEVNSYLIVFSFIRQGFR